MAGLGDTISRIAALRDGLAAMPGMATGADRLTDVTDFGANPGALRARSHVPAGLRPGAALVIVLHGCTQTAADYDRGSGWSQLADARGFAVLFPEQQRANNGNLCFNWFQPADATRGQGEIRSIISMIDTMIARHRLNPDRVFVTGLSAGGAMAMALLACHPERFAGGGIIAGLAYGVAASMPEAFDRMRGQGLPDGPALAARARNAAPAPARWPRLSVWQGDIDMVVAPANADAIVAQWTALHGLAMAPGSTEAVPGGQRRIWRDRQGDVALEAISIHGLGHGTPLAVTGAEALGSPGPFMLPSSLSSTRRLAAFWGLAPLPAAAAASPTTAPPGPASVAAIIDAALRQAGLRQG